MPLLRQRTRAEWLVQFEAAGVPCAPVHTVPEALAHPQVEALGILQPVPGDGFRLTGLPMSIDGHRPEHRSPAPRLGEHNAAFDVPAATRHPKTPTTGDS